MSPRFTQEQDRARIREMLSLERQDELDPFRVMAFIPLASDQTVADIGAGPGYFTLPLAKSLLDGKLYAVEVSPTMLEELRRRVGESRLGNVEIVEGRDDSVPLPPESLDGALLAFTLHELEDRKALLVSTRQALRPGAWLAVVEWLPEADGAHPHEDRIGPDALRALAAEVGLDFREWKHLSGKHYLAILQRRRKRSPRPA